MKNNIENIIKEEIDRFLINETLNNQDAPLYHFTSISNLMEILNDDYIYDTAGNGGISFTRNRNSMVGYPRSFSNISMVRLKFMPKDLNKLRNSNISKFSYFSIPKKSKDDIAKSTKHFKLEYLKMNDPYFYKKAESYDESEELLNIKSLPIDLCSKIDIYLNKGYFNEDKAKVTIYDLLLRKDSFLSFPIAVYFTRNDFNFERNGISAEDLCRGIDLDEFLEIKERLENE